MKTNLPNAKVYSFKYDQRHHDESIPYLVRIVHELDIDIVFGSSLGGWYALNVSAIANISCIVINLVTPEKMKDVIELNKS